MKKERQFAFYAKRMIAKMGRFCAFACFLFCSLVVHAAGQITQRVSLNLQNATMGEFIRQVKQQTGYTFFYNDKVLKALEPLTVREENVPLEEVLRNVLDGTKFTFVVEGETIVLKEAAPQVQEQKISGVVKDKSGTPLPGVTVMVKGAQVGVATDMDGKYTLSVAKGDHVLIFSMVGMKPLEVKVGERSVIDVVMEEDVAEMDEVVVTGIFKKARESYTGAVSTITAEELKLHRGQNLLQTLKNADISLNFRVDNLSGSDPNADLQINIRGNSSLPMSVQEYNQSASNAVNTPLVILDGFEISLEKLMDYNDEEIESINILKDASATAIYGSRGANGVIVVITKKPEAGRLKINAEVGMDMEIPDLTSYDLLNAQEKLELEKAVGLYDIDLIDNNLLYQDLYDARLHRVLSGATTDWISKPIRTGISSHYNLRLDGGSEQFRWGTSFNYREVAGAMKGSYRRTFNGAITLMYTLKDLTFRNYTSYGVSRSKESEYGIFSDYVKQQPYNSPYDEHGNLLKYLEFFYGSTRGRGESNPLYDAELNSFDKSGYENLMNNFSIEWNIIDGLTLRGQFGISTQNSHSDKFLPPDHSSFITNDYYNTNEGYFLRGSYTYGTGVTNSFNGNTTLSFSQVFSDKHQLYVGLDYSINMSKSYNYTFSMQGFSNPDMSFLGNALGYPEGSAPYGSENISRTLGFTGNVNYTYDNRYYLDLSARVDGSSSFGSDRKYAPFWSVGAGWNLHREKFLSDRVWVNSLRLKMSYGQTGSQQGSTSGANTLFVYQTATRYMNWSGSMLQSWGNSKLTWQTTNTFNIGTEFSLWNGCISGEFNFYAKRTSNLLSNMDLPRSMGLTSYVANIGEVKNKGWEASLSGYLIRNAERRFNIMLSGQLAYNKNWISKLSEAVKKQNEIYLKQNVDGVSKLFYEGKPQDAIYAVRSLGIDPSTGREIFLDRDGNITSTWKAGDKVYMGPSEAQYRGNLNALLMWKGLTFNMGFYYYWGGKALNSTLIERVEVTTDYLTESNVDRRVYKERWLKPGDMVHYKGFSEDKTKASSRFVMNDNVFELSTISLQYRWDTKWVRQYLGAQSVTFSVNMSGNGGLFHWGSIKQERGISYPFARNVQASVRFLF